MVTLVTVANSWKHEGLDPGWRVRDPAATAHPERPQTTGGLLQQTHPAAPGGGTGKGTLEVGFRWGLGGVREPAAVPSSQ